MKEEAMSNQIKSIMVVALLVVSFAIGARNLIGAPTVSASPVLSPKGSAKENAFHDAMRRLWEDHITWTRLFIVRAAADLPDKGPVTNRLLQNQVDIGNAVKPYYGDAAGEKLIELLKEHITTAAELVAAARANETAKMAEVNKSWHANADAIAAFLSGANPKSWPANEMKRMMHEHLELTTGEVQARLKGDWSADIAAYDRVHEQILHMADMLSEGIISQFPKKFD